MTDMKAQPTKILGPNLVGMLNAAGFYRKKEWVGLTGAEVNHIFAENVGYPERMMKEVEAKLKEKNTSCIAFTTPLRSANDKG